MRLTQIHTHLHTHQHVSVRAVFDRFDLAVRMTVAKAICSQPCWCWSIALSHWMTFPISLIPRENSMQLTQRVDYKIAITCGLMCSLILNISEPPWIELWHSAPGSSSECSGNYGVVKLLIRSLTIRVEKAHAETAMIWEEWISITKWQT